MLRTIIILTLFSLAYGSGEAQSLKAYQQRAEEAVAAKNYSAAMGYYKIIIEDAENDDIVNLYNAAQTARRFRVYGKAETYYGRVLEKENNNRYPLTNFWMGSVQKRQGKYDMAIASFEKYLANESALDGEYADEAKKHIQDCQWAKEQQANATELNIEHLNENVNTTDTEIGAFQMGDELYYASFGERNPDPDAEPNVHARLWVADNDNDFQFANARLLEGFEIEDQHVANPTFSEDGKRLYFNVCKSVNATEVRCKIYYRDRSDDGQWGEAVALPDHINLSGYTASQPSVGKSETGRTLLFFSSDRPDGVGQMDIWCSIMDDTNQDGTFAQPFNVRTLNTAGDDVTPFYHADAQTLYYSTDGKKTMGGLDVYRSRKNGNEWLSAEHLGAQVNTSYDEIYYSVSSDNTKRYFSSNRPGAMCGDTTLECTICNDLYAYEGLKIELLALTFNDISKLALMGCTVKLLDLTTGQEVPQVSGVGNEFRYLLEVDREYKLVATKDEYTMDLELFDTKGITESSFIEIPLHLRPQIKLIVLTYELPDSNLLNGCTVELFNITLNEADTVETKAFNHRFSYLLEPGMIHKIKGEKSGMGAATAEVSTKGISEPTTITRKLYLQSNLDFAILPLYFDNDRPGPKTLSTTTNLSYGKAYENYMKRKPRFVARNSYAAEKVAGIEDFFENQVTAGWERLKLYTEAILEDLRNGNNIEIIVYGHASPIAPSEYNFNLTQRRVVSLMNHFREHSDEMRRYLDETKQLTFKQQPKGEPEETEIDDSPKNPNASIYSLEACKARRVEIKIQAARYSLILFKTIEQN
ncbi:MAG: hypothetical protein AAF990_20110 [Bacteroidota bacterium]